jgi:hypothetical protein
MWIKRKRRKNGDTKGKEKKWKTSRKGTEDKRKWGEQKINRRKGISRATKISRE